MAGTDSGQAGTDSQAVINAHQRIDEMLKMMHEANTALTTCVAGMTTLSEGHKDHEQRIRTMERWQANLTPVLAALTFISGAVASQLVEAWL
jgi:hypothetical protein